MSNEVQHTESGNSPPRQHTVSRFYIGRLPGDEQEVEKVEQFLSDEFVGYTRYDATGGWRDGQHPSTVYEVVEVEQRQRQPFESPRAPYIAQVILAILNVPGRERKAVLWTVTDLADSGVLYASRV